MAGVARAGPAARAARGVARRPPAARRPRGARPRARKGARGDGGASGGPGELAVDEAPGAEELLGWQYETGESPRERMHSEEGGEAEAPWLDAVVKVMATHAEPDFSLPWQRKRQTTSTSSGFVIPGRLLLTNAHSVEHSTQVRVKRRGDDRSYLARVLTEGKECDMALLTVDDDGFWLDGEAGATRDKEPLILGRLPFLEDTVLVVGYPVGGDTLSVTRGVVSRVEITPYSLAGHELLSVQIDAAINPGNSGGPVFNEGGEVVGIAFESLAGDDAENVGYIIPTPIIRHFLTDYHRHGKYTGFPRLGLQLQNMENAALRRRQKLPEGGKGVLVQRVEPTGGAAGVLQPGDVLHAYDGVEIASDGTIPFRSGQRIGCTVCLMNKFAGETVEVSFSRDGVMRQTEIATRVIDRVVPAHIDTPMPPYFVCAGLVFTKCTEAYLRAEYGDDFTFEAPVNLVERMIHGMRSTEDEELVLLSKVLAHEISLGYEHVTNAAVEMCQGQRVRNLRHIVELVDAALANGDEYIEMVLDQNEIIVLEAKDVQASTKEILEQNSIPSDRSEGFALERSLVN